MRHGNSFRSLKDHHEVLRRPRPADKCLGEEVGRLQGDGPAADSLEARKRGRGANAALPKRQLLAHGRLD